MRHLYLATAFAVVAVLSVFGLRGTKFTHPPMDVFPEWAFPGMKHQPKPYSQGSSQFFADGRADRPIPTHTVARGELRADDHLNLGKNSDGTFARGFPASLAVEEKLMARGQERYAIYCQPCHGAVGDGNGITKRYGMGSTPTYHADRLRQMPDGEIFNTITNGVANQNMMPYADKLVPSDRWAVIAYVRALQRAQTGTLADVTDAAAKEALLKSK